RQLHAGGQVLDVGNPRRGLRAHRARQGPADPAHRLAARGPQRAAPDDHADRPGTRVHRRRRDTDRSDLQLAGDRPGHVPGDRRAGLPDAAGPLPDPHGHGDRAELHRRSALLPPRPEDHPMTTLPAGETLALAEDEAPRLQRGGFFFRVLRERKSAVVGLGIIIFFIVLSLVAPYISPYSATQQTCRVYAPPSPRHWLGCDDGGIDMVSLLMQGGRISLVVGVAATFVAMFIGGGVGLVSRFFRPLGGGVGLLSGYFGRWVDVSLMRVTDYLLVIPDLVFMTVIAAVWGASLFHVIMVIGILEWASTARIIRAQVMSLRERVYVKRARA